MNILTIDFDIIMKPSINFYNDKVGNNDPLQTYIDEFSFIANLPADLYIYEYLTRHILECTKKNPDKVYFISDHASAIDIIKNIPHKESINLINIDHHHDLGYDDIDWKRPILHPKCGNWVKYCKEKKLIDGYVWIHNSNSDIYPKEGQKYVQQDIELRDGNLEQNVNNVDCLIICASYEWVPPLYHPLFLTWQTMCEEMNGKEYPLDEK